ncbi:MAG: heavy metal translocating P-type ATPase [Calditrichia bacterium]
MNHYELKNLDCASCAAKIEDGLKKLDSVQFVSVNFATTTLLLESDAPEEALSKIKEIEPAVEVVSVRQNSLKISGNELYENRLILARIGATFALLLAGFLFKEALISTPFKLGYYLVYYTAYLLSGYTVLRGAFRNIVKGRVFDEQFLMTVATLGAFAIGELPEAVSVMFFYVVGEFFQELAVNRSRRSVKTLLALKPESANLKLNGQIRQVKPEEVEVGQSILVKPGERVPLDGLVLEGESELDASALTGESLPIRLGPGQEILAGMINKSGVLTVQVTRPFQESSVARILEMVEDAASRKAESEKFITTFARYYTPAVVVGALGLALLPPLLLPGAAFSDWIYRALVVLVISCPCALVISIPLGYFGGIGAAATRGILVKGSNFLDALQKLKTVVWDKTGTLTRGEFAVSKVVTHNGYSEKQLLEMAALAERHSGHPIGRAIVSAAGLTKGNDLPGEVKEIPGRGVLAKVANREILAGNDALLHLENIDHPECHVPGTVVHVAVNREYMGYLVISDSLKPDVEKTIKSLEEKGVQSVMLTGDNADAAAWVAQKTGIRRFFAGLLPGDKVRLLEEIMQENSQGTTAFVGDGINDAPVLARADVGIAMGALGSDAAIETADVVLMTDRPSKVLEAIEISRRTRKIVWQNIAMALGVKGAFIALGIIGVAGMWEAVIGDMGVALAAIFNALRVKWD